MAKNKTPTYCWDTTTAIAWLTEEEGAPLADIAVVVHEVDAGSANLIIPATVYSELLEARCDADKLAEFEAFLKRSNVFSVDLTPQIAKRAAALRERADAERPKRKIRTPDAQIVATAIAYKVDALHSLDKGMLKLNGHETAEGLAIVKPIPHSGQRGLDY